MYCKNCGKELLEGEVYCSKCGVKVGDAQRKTFDISTIGDMRKLINSVHDGIERLGSSGKVFLGSIICLIINVFLIKGEMFTISYKVLYQQSITLTMFENNEALSSLFVLGYIAAIVAMLLPLVLETEWKSVHFLLSKIVTCASLGWFLVVVLKAIISVTEQVQGYTSILNAMDISFKLTGNAWLFLIGSIGALLMTASTSKALLGTAEDAEKDNAFKPFMNRY